VATTTESLLMAATTVLTFYVTAFTILRAFLLFFATMIDTYDNVQRE